MRIWKVLFTVLTIISASLGLMNIISYDVTMPIMIVFMGLTLLTNASNGVQGVQTRLKRKDRFESK